MTTTLFDRTPTITYGGSATGHCPKELLDAYTSILNRQRLSWTTHQRMIRLLGAGGQGVVYLSERRGSDEFTLPVALKIFSPQHYSSSRSYDEHMRRIAHIAARVAQIQHDNLLTVQNFVERSRIRILQMEWIDGYDLDRLLAPAMLQRARERVSNRRWTYINNVIATAGPLRTRLKPGMAVAIVRECLAALGALHREEIVHGDIKPSNIMVKRTGNAKVIDIGSALDLNNLPDQRTCTLQYAAPEMLDRNEFTPRSDLASLGYVLIELLAGRPLFSGARDLTQLLEEKRTLPHRLESILPPEIAHSSLLLTNCRRLTTADPTLRFASAEEADNDEQGLAEFQRSLVKVGLASEYENELRVWLEELD